MRSYVVSVSFRTGCYRHIQIDGDATLLRLHGLIADAFSLDANCSHGFFLDNRFWGRDAYMTPRLKSGDKLTKDCVLENLLLYPGKEFKYIYNLGCEMRFQCRILIAPNRKENYSGVLRSVGDTPENYLLSEDEKRRIYTADSFHGDSSRPQALISGTDAVDYPFAYVPIAKRTTLLLRQYLCAAANLYGIISMQELLNIYNSQNAQLPESVFVAAIILMLGDSHGADCFTFVQPLGFSPTLEHPLGGIYLSAVRTAEKKRFCELLRSQEGKPLLILPKQEFLLYANPVYFPETEERKNMLAYLECMTCLTGKEVQSCCNDIQLDLVQDCNPESILQNMKTRGLAKDENWNLWTFLRMLQALSNHTHRYKNRGYSPDELRIICARDSQYGIEGQISLFDDEGR